MKKRQKLLSLVAAMALSALVGSAPTTRAQSVDLVAAKQDQDARLAEVLKREAEAQKAQATTQPIAEFEHQADAIRSEDLWSKTDGPPAMDLRNAPADGFHPFNFAVLSDLHLSERQGKQRLAKVLDLISRRHDLAFVIVLGDIVWDRNPEDFKPILAKAGVPVHLVYGNNDWKWVSNGTYEKAFGPRDYSFDYANCRFVAMYDCLPKGQFPADHKGDFNEQQWSYMDQQFADAKQKGMTHTFVAMHVPPATPGGYDPFFYMFTNTEKRFWDLLEKYGVDGALFGHLHQAAEWKHDNIQCYVNPSCCWNFISRSQKVDSSFCRIVKVEKDSISAALLPVRLDGETFTYDTLKRFYDPNNHPK